MDFLIGFWQVTFLLWFLENEAFDENPVVLSLD